MNTVSFSWRNIFQWNFRFTKSMVVLIFILTRFPIKHRNHWKWHCRWRNERKWLIYLRPERKFSVDTEWKICNFSVKQSLKSILMLKNGYNNGDKPKIIMKRDTGLLLGLDFKIQNNFVLMLKTSLLKCDWSKSKIRMSPLIIGRK